MDKNAIKKYAVWARRELISRVAQRAALYEITEDGFGDPEAQSAHGRVLTDEEKAQRRALVARIRQEGYQQVTEEVAYTWFNRFIALRFMEVNGYLPSRVRVFTDENNQFKPQILAEAMNLELDGLDPQKVYAFKNANDNDGLFKYMVIVQCNALSAILPRMFQRISDYTELLFPDNLLREGSVVERMISAIAEDDWRDAVQIIGWLYQYYNAEKKDEVFAALKKNVKITKENIPAATQLFTPDWIVRYMVENSLGRLWVEGHPNDDLKANWKYYLEEAEQEPDVQVQLAEIRKEYAAMKPEDIKCIDPCCGSGHILAYLFDVLVQIYESYGYTTREAVEKIVQNNLYGLDIDDRAAQLAYFAVMMKARQYDRRFFSRQIQPNVYAIQESNGIDRYALEYFCNGDAKLKAAMDNIITEMTDAKEYGSILNITPVDFAALFARFDEVRDDISISKESVLNSLLPLVQVAHALALKYDVVVTNPPYMGSSGMGLKLAKFVKASYPDSKNDLFACFIERGNNWVVKNGFNCMVTVQSWMFLSSFERMREKILDTISITNLMHMETLVMGIAFGTAAAVFRNFHIANFKGTYNQIKLQDVINGCPKEFPVRDNAFAQVSTDKFSKMPSSPIAYWLPKKLLLKYTNGKTMKDIAYPKVGMQTSNNDKYLRLWFEVNYEEFRGTSLNLKWIKYLKGGSYRKWYGNLDHLLFYNRDKKFIGQQVNARVLDLDFLQKRKCTWTDLTSGNISFRLAPNDTFYDISGHCFFPSEQDQLWLLAYANSLVFSILKRVFNSTFHCQVGDVAKIVVPDLNESQREEIAELSGENVGISKTDWDSFETSWDFKKHPLL